MLNSTTIRFCTDIFGLIDPDAEIDTEKDQDVLNPGDSGSDPGTTITTEPEVIAPFNRQAMAISKTAWNCTNKVGVTGFNITEYKPSGTKIRMIFKIGSKYYTLNSSGNLVEFTLAVTADNILKSGNYPSQLNALTDVPGFVGEKIYPIIALQAPSTAEDVPAVKMGLKVISASNVVTDTQTSDVYELTEGTDLPKIIEVTANIATTGEGSVTAQIRLRDAENNWTSYMDLDAATDKEAQAVQFKFVYKVATPDSTDSARVNFISVNHTFGRMIVSGEDADLYTVVQDYDVPLQMCYVVVRHAPLIDSKIDAYVNFMHAPKKRELLRLGRGNGSVRTLTLGEDGVKDNNINASTIKLYADDKLLTKFSYNSEVATVTFTAKNGAAIYASYEYDHDVEEWRKMTLDSTEPYNGATGDCASRFVYSLKDSEAADKVISNVRLRLRRPTGTVSGADLGTGTKHKRLTVLPHIPKTATITFTDEAVSWTYDEESNTLTTVAPTLVPIVVSYSWQGEPIKIYSVAAGWSVA